MAEAITIRTELGDPDVLAFARRLKAGLQSALDSGTDGLRATGKKIGDALSAGASEALRKNEAAIALAREKGAQARQVAEAKANAQILIDQKKAANEQAAIAAKAAADRVRIEADAQAKLAQIRAKGVTQAAAENAKLQQEALKSAARLEAEATKSAGRIAQINAKRQADLDVVRERFAQREIERQRKIDQQAANNQGASAFFRRYSSTIREAGESIQQAGFALTGLTTGIIALGRTAVSSAVDLDRQVNVLKALTGSAEAAEARFAQLVATAQRSPGLTTSLAATLDAQLRVANVSVATIDKILPAIGRLNAVAPLGDPQKFAGNLTQLITQGFERTDLKELVGQSPLAGELIKQIFNVDNATNAAAIRESAKKLGIDTTEEFFAAFAQAAASNSKLAGVTESIGTQFEKLRDRVIVAFRPLGLALIEALQPLVERAVPIIEKLSQAFAALPDSAKQLILVFTAIIAATGPLIIAIGGLIQAFGAFGNIVTVIAGTGGTAGIAGLLATLAPIILPIIAALGALGAAWATNFGGIRDLTRDVVTEISAQFAELRAFWNEIAPDLLAIIKPILEVIQVLFETWSGTIGTIYRNAWEVIKTVTREAGDVIGPLIRALLALIRGDFETFGQRITEAWRQAWEFIVLIPNRALLALYDIVVAGIKRLLDISGIAKSVGETLGTSLVTGIKDAITGLFPSTVALVRGVISTANELRNNFAGRDKARSDVRAINADAARAIQIEQELESRVSAANNFIGPEIPTGFLNPPKPPPPGSGGGGGSAESKARQLRDAQLKSELSFLKESERLQRDSNERQLKLLQEQFDTAALLTADGFAKATVTLRGYYDEKLRLTQANINGQISLIDAEIAAENKALNAAKVNTPERIRLQEQVNRLTADREVLVRSLTDAERENVREFDKGLKAQRDALLEETQRLIKQSEALGNRVIEGQLPTDLIKPNKNPIVEAAREQIRRAQEQESNARLADLAVQQQELQIQQAISQGVISEAQGKEATLAIQRQLRDVLISSLEAQKALETDPEKLARLNLEIQKLATFGQQLTPAQAFFKGLRSEAETTAEAFERIGSNFKDKFLGVLDGGIDRLTQKFGFFKDLVGDILKSLTRKVISQLFGLGNPGGGGSAPAGGGSGFNVSSILGKFLNIGGASQSSAQQANLASVASVFTPGFAGGSGAGGVLGSSGGNGIGSLAQALLGPSSPLSAPASVSLPGFGGLPGISQFAIPGLRGPGAGELRASGLGKVGNLNGLSSLFSGIGFGKTAGSGGALAGLLPLLGVSLGSGLGTDTLTKILGGAAGGLLGVGLTAAPAIIGTGGLLSGLGFLAPLFSNPITAIAAGLALPAIFLLGRARQRRRDEASSGDFLQDAIDSIRDLRKQVSSDQIDGAQARSVFNNEILQTFIQQINTLKTKSVRESRLKNQTADLKKLFEDEVGPEIEAQKLRSKTALRLVPEFALGGIVPGMPTGADTVLSWLSPREMVLTVQQQRSIAAMAGPEVFAAAGVPGAGLATSDGGQAFQFGGVVQPSGSSGGRPTVINVYVTNSMSRDDSIDLLAVAAESDDGQQILANAQRAGRRNRVAR